jgi:hypothetical protein
MTEHEQYLLSAAFTVLLLAPMLAGIFFALRYRQRWPWTARFLIPGLIALEANVFGSMAVRWYAYRQHSAIYEDAALAAQRIAMMHSTLFFLNYAGILLVAAAAFADRGIMRIGRLTIGSGERKSSSSVKRREDL